MRPTPRSRPTAARPGRCSQDRSTRAAPSRMRARTPRRSARTGRRCRPSPGRSAPGSMPASRRRRRTTTTWRGSSTATTRTSRRTRRTGRSWRGTRTRPADSACSRRTSMRTAAPVGAPATMPGTGAMNIGMLGRTPLVARSGGGFYVAYPTPERRPGVARGAGNAPVVAGIDNSPAVAIAAAGDGRIWVLWTKGFGDPDVLARRSNKGATRFGATVNAGHPKDATAGLQARRERRRERARRARQLQHRHHVRRGHVLPPAAARAHAAGQPGRGCARASRPRCASRCATRATP